MSAVRWTYSRCSCLASGEPIAQYLGHAEQRRRLGACHGDQPGAQLGVGQFGAGVDDELFHHHLPAGADGAAEALRLGADALVVDPDRSGDGVLRGQQDRHVGGDPVDQRDAVADLVHLRLPALEHAGDALLDVRRHIGRVR